MSQLTPTALELRTMLLLPADTYTQPQYSKKGKYVPCFTYHSDTDPQPPQPPLLCPSASSYPELLTYIARAVQTPLPHRGTPVTDETTSKRDFRPPRPKFCASNMVCCAQSEVYALACSHPKSSANLSSYS